MKVIPISNNNFSYDTKKSSLRTNCKPMFKAMSTEYKKISSLQKYINRKMKKNLCDCDFSRYEGTQRGLKTFEGLSISQMAFAFTDLHSINMIGGCNNHCLHCYANAQPYIKRYPFEDLVQICSDIKEFTDRTGLNLLSRRGEARNVEMFFDSDALDCHLYDSEGKKHDYVEIAKMMYEKLGHKPVFDTSGWSRKDKVKQRIAEEYVQRLLQDGNYRNFYQINISINPFSTQYVKILNSVYPIEELASSNNVKAKNLYKEYLDDMVNVLYTFKPLLSAPNFSFIVRAMDDSVSEMKGYRKADFRRTIQDILFKLYGMMSENEFEQYEIKLNRIETNMFVSGRLENFYRVKNRNIDTDEGMNRIDGRRIVSDERFEKLKKGLLKSFQGYSRMISADGRVYLFDNYAIIPTDVRINTSTPEIPKPFSLPLKDFMVTEKNTEFKHL